MFQCVSLSRQGLLSLCPCDHQLLLGLLPARLKAEVWRGRPRLCADRTARRLLSSAREDKDRITLKKKTGVLDTKDRKSRRLTNIS